MLDREYDHISSAVDVVASWVKSMLGGRRRRSIYSIAFSMWACMISIVVGAWGGGGSGLKCWGTCAQKK